MKQVVIENPILNSPFEEPRRHFKFDDEGITNEIVESRRVSSYFIPVPKSKKKGRQMVLDTEWTQERIEENKEINRIRGRIAQWRQGGYQGITSTTRRLLEHWKHLERSHPLFFCQIEALETAIYLTEVANKYGDNWIENLLRQEGENSGSSLFRMAFKMATGSGKTVVMAMLIAWQVLNKKANPQDSRFTDTFLIVSPGITIRDRLRVLLPSDPDNYYKKWELLPDPNETLGEAKVLITNYHAFILRERGDASKMTKAILANGESSAFRETPEQMVRRACRELGSKKNIIVINDEAHHCYRHKPDAEEEKLTGDERKEAEKREEEARVWINGLEAVQRKIGIKAVYDLSATPFFLRGSGYSEGTLFPWVVSDFSLIDAIESGIVKVPRVPVADDSMIGEQPTYRDLWLRIREHLPKKGRGTEAAVGAPVLPTELEGALKSLYGNYEKYYRLWEQNPEAREKRQTPPVFIVVCNNTNVSKLVYDWIAGYEKPLPDGQTALVPGNLSIFSNVERDAWFPRPNTILIDSEQLESGEAMSPEFKKIASREIEEFKMEYRARFPGRNAEDLTDEDLLREVMNTVGKPDKLGEHVKCVVSVSMLTEGWDANTVTHILGVRAFGTQLLCEQVVGRGLRRRSYALDGGNLFAPEYAEVYGVPFSFIPCSGSQAEPKPGPIPTRVRALEDRIACEITFPRLLGYRYDIKDKKLSFTFTKDSQFSLSTELIPSWTDVQAIIGSAERHTLEDIQNRREQEVAFLLAKLTLENYFRTDGPHPPSPSPSLEKGLSKDRSEEEPHEFTSEVQAWLFPQVLAIARRWMAECVICKDNAFPQMLLLAQLAHTAAGKIYGSIVSGTESAKLLKPILRPYDTLGSTRYVDFDTIRPVYSADPNKCHVNYVVADTGSWEQKVAQALEEMKEVVSYVKNQSLGFTIPYTIGGEEHNYTPDFIAHIDDGQGPEDLLNLIVEVSGDKSRKETKDAKEAKVATARNLWVPAVNNHGGFGRWAFIEIEDPWNAKNVIRAFLAIEGAHT